MPKYIRNTPCDIDFLSKEGMLEYLEDELTKLPPKVINNQTTSILFKCLRDKKSLDQIKSSTKSISWIDEPFELQSIAVGLKLFRI